MPVVRTVRRLALVLAGGVGIMTLAGLIALTRAPGGVQQFGFRRVLSAGEVTYAVPNAFLQARVAESFPRTIPITAAVGVELSDPRFPANPGGDSLRYEISFAMRGIGTGPAPSGRATMRTQLKFDRTIGAITLAKVELVSVAGLDEDPMASTVLPTLFAHQVAPQLEGKVIYALPRHGGYWQRKGAEHVRDVRIEGGEIVVVVGM